VKIFDVHPHVVSHDRDRYPLSRVYGAVANYVTERPLDMDQMLAEMDAAGVAKSVLTQASTAYGYDNRYVADSAAAHPDRFASVCSVDVRAADAPERLRYWIVDRKMNGTRIYTAHASMAEDSDWLVDPKTFPAWETAAELGVPVCLQMRAGGFRVLPVLLERFPSVPIVLDHAALPPAADGPPYHGADPLWALKGAKNLYLKITVKNFLGWNEGASTTQAFLGKCIETFGIDHIVWGSNFPASEGPLSALVALAQRELAFLSEPEREQIFNGTAQTLYPALA
jgi:predicted TIM-barrel fold metal-dependent hydrolase